MKRIGQVAVVCTAVLALACNVDRSDTDTSDSGTIGTAGVSGGDRNFVDQSLEAGMAEVELGNLARTNASSAEVKQFAEMMVRDHTKAGDELKQIAQQYAIAVPADMDDHHLPPHGTIWKRHDAC